MFLLRRTKNRNWNYFTDSILLGKKCKIFNENFRVEQIYENWFWNKTDGSINPKILTEAAKVLIHHFVFSDERTLEADEIAQTESYDEESLHMRQLLKTKLVDMDLSVRALNCLKALKLIHLEI
jgi:DNA-directed RNA polymerase subunit alpha